MAAFDERERDFEARFKHDQELQFKVKAYAKAVVDAEFEGGDRHVIDKVCADLNAEGHSVTPAQLRFELTHLEETAKQQVMRE